MFGFRGLGFREEQTRNPQMLLTNPQTRNRIILAQYGSMHAYLRGPQFNCMYYNIPQNPIQMIEPL